VPGQNWNAPKQPKRLTEPQLPSLADTLAAKSEHCAGIPAAAIEAAD
jgi:hypothetical protein